MLEAQIIVGDCRDILRTLPAGSVQCCVTSPPYWGLRDYGTAEWKGGEPGCEHKQTDEEIHRRHFANSTLDGGQKTQRENANSRYRCHCGARRIDAQLGLEPTPDEYITKMVAVFREVWRVLRDDGTLWVNMGDSYAGAGHYENARKGNLEITSGGASNRNGCGSVQDLKPKDLCGIPWRLAFALQQPYYAGSIKDERDRIWLAAMLDAEGCMFIHRRKEGQHNGQGYFRQNDTFSPGVEISNTHQAVVDRIMAIVGKGSICTQGPDENTRRKQMLYRWNLRTTESKDLIRELYPHLVAKRHQARILYGCPSSGDDAKSAHLSLIAMHRGLPPVIDFKDPPSCFEPGFYLRSDIIWNKKNPMPESVTDRPTKAHEYIFLLSKAERYFYDAEAIREPQVEPDRIQRNSGNGYETKQETRIFSFKPHEQAVSYNPLGRNKRSVWTVATQPYAEAHFATFPEDLIKPCILAGSKLGDTVLDPFAGSGTTGKVVLELGRSAILIELNPAYAQMARDRTNVTPGFL